jgi:hypothetical protein
VSDLEKILLTSASTIVGGVIVLVAGQILGKFFLEPIQEQARLIGEIANTLILYGNTGSGIERTYSERLNQLDQGSGSENADRPTRLAIERYESLIRKQWGTDDTAAEVYRQQASMLLARTHAIWWYKPWSALHVVPPYENVLKASTELVGLANSVHDPHTFDRAERASTIARLLSLQVIL